MAESEFTVQREGWNFTIVHNDVIESDMSTVQKMVYVAICHFADSRGKNSFPSYKTIGKLAGCSRRAAIMAVDKLVERGFVRKDTRMTADGQTSNIYTILSSRSEARARGSERSARGVVNEVHRGSEHGAPERDPSNDSQFNESTREKRMHEKHDVPIGVTQYERLCEEYEQATVDEYILKAKNYCAAKNKRPYADFAAAAENWLHKDGVPKRVKYYDYRDAPVHIAMHEARAAD